MFDLISFVWSPSGEMVFDIKINWDLKTCDLITDLKNGTFVIESHDSKLEEQTLSFSIGKFNLKISFCNWILEFNNNDNIGVTSKYMKESYETNFSFVEKPPKTEGGDKLELSIYTWILTFILYLCILEYLIDLLKVQKRKTFMTFVFQQQIMILLLLIDTEMHVKLRIFLTNSFKINYIFLSTDFSDYFEFHDYLATILIIIYVAIWSIMPIWKIIKEYLNNRFPQSQESDDSKIRNNPNPREDIENNGYDRDNEDTQDRNMEVQSQTEVINWILFPNVLYNFHYNLWCWVNYSNIKFFRRQTNLAKSRE